MSDSCREFGNLPRVLGTYDPPGPSTAMDGPEGERLLVLVGGLHGNEPAGVRAIRTFFEQLEEHGLSPRGHVLGISGNRAALKQGKRYIDEDLNRLWNEETVRIDRPLPGPEATVEAREQREILEALGDALARRPSRVTLLDLHSTSAEGSPFAIMSDTLQNRSVASALGIPIVLGLEERVQGTLLSWFSEMGHRALCVEGGQNAVPSTVDHHLAVIWITLVSGGFLDEEEVPGFEEHRERLQTTAWGLPDFCEIRFRYEVPDDAGFEMVPGYTNFHLVSRGMHLAYTAEDGVRREVRCPHDGQLIMPRYQGQGDDGFFLGTEVPTWALRLSATVRTMRFVPFLRAMPGVSKDPSRPRGLIVDRRIARWRTVEILHLFGYRRCAAEGEKLYFLRRPDRLTES